MATEVTRVGTFSLIRRWAEMVKIAHSVFALPFALMATFLAARAAYRVGDSPHVYPRWEHLLLIVGCMVAARSVAMTFNRIVDAAIDARNPRTLNRPLPAGTISRMQANVFLGAGSAAFVAMCGGFWLLDRNPWPILLSVPTLIYLCFYSYTKRFTSLAHFVLGSAIAFSPVAAWIAIHPASLGWPALLLMGAVTCWIGGFDIIYACQDLEVDRREGLFSLPARLGPRTALWIARIAHVGTVALLAMLIPVVGLGWLYVTGLVIVSVLLTVENALVRADDFSRINLAFFTVNGVISLLLGVLTIADILFQLGPVINSGA